MTDEDCDIPPPPPYTEGLCYTGQPSQRSDAEKSSPCLHYVQPDDTVTSICLAYNVPIDKFRKINRLWADHTIIARNTVWIPDYYGPSKSRVPGIEFERKAAVKRFQIATKCIDYDHAKLVMEFSNYHFDKAVEMYKDDLAWEKSHQKM